MANTSELKQAITSGVLRPNNWQCIINFPDAIPDVNASNQITALARSTAVPQSTLGVITIPISGRNLKIAGDRTFEPFTVTILGVQDMTVRRALETWSENINGSSSNAANLVSFDSYTADITLNLLDQSDNILKTYVLEDAWCQSVGPMNLSQEELDTIINFDVTFEYLNVVTDTTL